MSALKLRASLMAVLLAITAVLAFLARRGLRAGIAGDMPTQTVWREADEADLFEVRT